MLPADHPSSFCKLSGLTTEELNLVMEASGFVVKRGKNSMRRDAIIINGDVDCSPREATFCCVRGRKDSRVRA
jgi:hypothetical protein